VCCGLTADADHEISAYPFRYIPARWSVGSDHALRCAGCTRAERYEPEFFHRNDVLLYQEDRYGDGPSFYVRTYPRQIPQTDNKITLNTDRTTDDKITLNTEAAMPNPFRKPKENEMNNDNDNNPASTTNRRRRAPVTRKDRLKGQARDVGGAVGLGIQLAAANEAGEVMVDIAKELTSELPAVQVMLEHEDGRELAKLIVALMLHTGTSQIDVIPQGALIGKACELQMTASSFQLIGPRLNKLRKHFTKLAKIGAGVTGDVTTEGYTDEELRAAYAEMEEELAELRFRVAEQQDEREAEEEEAAEVEEVEEAAPTRRRSRK
jgi:hypothetical protein